MLQDSAETFPFSAVSLVAVKTALGTPGISSPSLGCPSEFPAQEDLRR